MVPLPAATTTLANMQSTSQPVLDAFIPYAYLEIGITIGALLVLFLIYLFWDTITMFISRLRSGHLKYGDYSSKHRDSEATSQAIHEHRRFQRLMGSKDRVSRYD